MFVVAVGDALGVASIMPFIALLSNPEVVTSNRYLASAYEAMGFTSVTSFMFFLGLLTFAMLVGSLVLRALGLWATLHFSQMRSHVWSSKLIRGYLYQPYEWFLNRHSAQLASSVLSEVDKVVNGALYPALQATAQGMVVLVLMALLVAVDPMLAIQVAVVIGGAYAIVFWAFRPHIVRLGEEWWSTTRQRFRIVQEALGGIKDVKASSLEQGFIRRFEQASHFLATRGIMSQMIQHVPNLAMQAILFGGMLLVLLYLMENYGGFQDALPILAVYAFAGYRLMPALQTVYREVSQVRGSEATLDALASDLNALEPVTQAASRAEPADAFARLDIGKGLELREISYTYPLSDQPALRKISVSVPACSTVGLVGATGSGKTTIIDIVLGLLRPQEGELSVGGVAISDTNRRKWQRSLGYVPQQIFLIDDSVAANIAFGVPADEVDFAAVEAAARIANLHEFVVNELPDGYLTHVGEHGVRLSGGQRQRIIIARALYRDPDVLVLDEATSALDNLTEHAVMEAIQKLGRSKSIILIAHRLSTVRHCDCIYLLDRGEVIASGTYDELLLRNSSFRAMAEVSGD
jgi:ABC-type bacteriocin/lantibiotic exporter with double-glycine peptidase domain